MSLRAKSRVLFVTSVGACVALVASPLPAAIAGPPAAAATEAPGQDAPSVPGARVGAIAAASSAQPRLGSPLPKPVLPAAGAAEVSIDPGGRAASAGALPLQVASAGATSPASVRVSLLAQSLTNALRGRGVSFVVRRTDGGSDPAPVKVTLDYSKWRHLAGANFGDRLVVRPRSLCQIYGSSTPCSQPAVLPAVNDQVAGTLTFQVLAQPDYSTTAAPEAAVEESAVPTATASVEPSEEGRSFALAAEDAPSPSPEATESVAPTTGETPFPSDTPTPVPSGSPEQPTELDPVQEAVCEAVTDPGAEPPAWCTPGGEAPSGELPGVFTTMSSSSGSAGTYKVANMIDPAQWAGGLQSGDFTYSYGLKMPPSIGGDVPTVALGYSAQSVDGRTSAQNAQASPFGMGWDYAPGYVSQSFMGCGEQESMPSMQAYGDLCEVDPLSSGESNFTLTLGGTTSRMFVAGGEWRLEDDPGWKITPLGNQAWKVQTQDGTAYYFGLGTRVGGTKATNSLWTVPVFQTHDSSCASAGSYCWKAWRANLDAVVDPNGNAQYFTYAKRTNVYHSDKAQTDFTYARGGFVSDINYGLSTRTADNFSAAWVEFVTSARCVENTDTNTQTECPGTATSNWGSYPDTPLDLICTSAPCSQNSPAFFETEMVTHVIVRTPAYLASGYSAVDHYYFDYSFPPPGSGSSSNYGTPDAETPSLWLDKIRHVGTDPQGIGEVTVPDVTFGWTMLPNRVDTTASVLPMRMPRINVITTESGQKIYPTMSDSEVGAACTASALPNQTMNRQQCFPQWYTPEGSGPGWGWYFKYVLTAVNITYPTTNASGTPAGAATPDELFDYQYSAPSTAGGDQGALWDYDFNASTNHHEFSTWRGFPKVRTVHGSTGVQDITDRWYYTGLAQHPTSTDGTGTRQSNVVTTHETVYDENRFVGRLIRESSNSSTGHDLVSSRHSYEFVNTLPGTTAGFRSRTTLETETDITGTSVPRRSRTDWTYDTGVATGNGMVTSEYVRGEVDASGNPTTTLDRCTTYDYVKNTSGSTWITGLVQETQVHNGPCGATTLIGRSKTFFDGQPFSTPPVKGNPTLSHVYTNASQYNQSGAAYDAYGRVFQSWDKPDSSANTTLTTFTPAEGCDATSCRQPDAITVTTPLGDVTKSENFAWARGVPLKVTDPNGKVTAFQYDQLGRLISRTAPGDVVACPTEKFGYVLTNSKPLRMVHQQLRAATIVGSSCTASSYLTTYTFLDAAGRQIQTQQASPGGSGGYVLTWNSYNNRGLPASTSEPYYNAGGTNGAEQGEYFAPNPASIPTSVHTVYDELSRPTDVVTKATGSELWRTQTAYLGDAFETTPPASAGVGKTKTWVDVFGRAYRTDEYETEGASTWINVTTTEFNRRGDAVKLTDPEGLVTQTSYDLLGAPTWVTNKDSGSRSMYYDSAGNLTRVTRDGTDLNYTVDAQHRVRQVAEETRVLRKWRYGEGTAAVADPTLKTLNQVGRVMTTDNYDQGNHLISTNLEYDGQGRLTKNTTNIPNAFGPVTLTVPTVLRGAWTNTFGYDRAGNVTSVVYPGKSGTSLKFNANETVTATYDSLGLPSTLTGTVSLITDHTWTNDGRLKTRKYQAGGVASTTYFTRNYTWDPQVTSRLWGRSVVQTKGTVNTSLQNENISYDALGNPVEIRDVKNTQWQCFDYDQRLRLKRAFTAAVACSTPPTTTGTAPDGYDTTYVYDRQRNALEAAGSKNYVLPAETANQPHAPTSITSGGVTETFTYNPATGELEEKVRGGTATTDYVWDNLGQLTKTTSPTTPNATNSWNAYDAGGARILRRTSTVGGATTTLSVAGQEITVDDAGVIKKENRLYNMAGSQVAARVSEAGAALRLFWIFNDRQNSAELTVDDQTVKDTPTPVPANVRRYTPFGAQRNSTVDLKVDKDFLNKTRDADSGLLHVGARYYNANDGLFISTDPLAGAAGTASLNPYSYANNNPVSFSDPSGLKTERDYYVNYAASGVERGTHDAVEAAADQWIAEHVDEYGDTIDSVLSGKADCKCDGARDWTAYEWQGFLESLPGHYARGGSTSRAGQLHWGQQYHELADAAGMLGGGTKAARALRSFFELKTLRAGQRLAADVAVNPRAPARLGTSRSIGRASHNAALQKMLRDLPDGASDVRVNQQQVNAAGKRVGINRPDLQYTVDGRRHYVEFEGPDNPRGAMHEARIMANDPDGVFQLESVP